jgi:plasmid replication initiation protein
MEDKQVAAKSNVLVDSRHKLSTHQQRVFMLFVSKIRPKDKPDKTYRLKWHDLLEVSKGYLSTRGKITELFKGMLKKSVILSREVDEEATFFSYYKNDHVGKEVFVRVDQSIQQELFDLIDRYALIDLESAINLDSPYYIRLYEILKSRMFKSARSGAVEIKLDSLKWSLGCDNVKTYEVWGNFKRYVLDKAQAALKKNTDIKFSYKTVLSGRKVEALEFKIEENEKWQSTINSILSRKLPTPKSIPVRDFIRSGDTIRIGGDLIDVGLSVAEHNGKSFTVGQLTSLLRSGKIELVKQFLE